MAQASGSKAQQSLFSEDELSGVLGRRSKSIPVLDLQAPVAQVKSESESRANALSTVTPFLPTAPRVSLLMLVVLFMMLLFLVLGIVDTINMTWPKHPALAIAHAVFWLLILFAVVGFVGREWRALSRLARQQLLRRSAQQVLDGQSIPDVTAFVSTLVAPNSEAIHRHAQWLEHADPDASPAALLASWEQLVLDAQDQQAEQVILQAAREFTAVLAITPYSMLDFVHLVRSYYRLLGQLGEIYGVEFGLFSRYRLGWFVLVQLLDLSYARAVAEVGNKTIANIAHPQFSNRTHHALGSGLLLARLSIQSVALLRPLPHIDRRALTLEAVCRAILAELRKQAIE